MVRPTQTSYLTVLYKPATRRARKGKQAKPQVSRDCTKTLKRPVPELNLASRLTCARTESSIQVLYKEQRHGLTRCIIPNAPSKFEIKRCIILNAPNQISKCIEPNAPHEFSRCIVPNASNDHPRHIKANAPHEPTPGSPLESSQGTSSRGMYVWTKCIQSNALRA